MPDESRQRHRNFLLGNGESLTEPVRLPRRAVGEKAHPYTLAEVRDVLAPRAVAVSEHLTSLPDLACPAGSAVALLTLHPTYLGRSYFPEELLLEMNAEAVGSRARELAPRKWTRVRHGERAVTVELFVAASRVSFRRFSVMLPAWSDETPGAGDLRKLEDVRVWSLGERLPRVPENVATPMMEVVLHAADFRAEDIIIEGFREYLKSLDISLDLDRRIYAGGLCFMPARVPRDRLAAVAEYAFLRVVRPMPKLRVAASRGARPARRHHVVATALQHLVVPPGPPLDPTIRVAVVDGGCDAPECSPYIKQFKEQSVGKPAEVGVVHGTKVTSALLFGPVPPDGRLPRPFAAVDHHRIIDESTIRDDDDAELYSVLPRLQRVLRAQPPYEFLNISVAPDIPVEDNEPHPWTTVLDEALASGNTLAFVAAGNLGEGQSHNGSQRICPPADSVNGMSVGACDTVGAKWRRAPYSSLGPGRSPGIVKPDVLHFGGSSREPFRFVAPGALRNQGLVTNDFGTSYAAPAALRMGLGVRAHLGPVLSPLAIKALLIHACPEHGYPRPECGWGRVPDDLEELLTVDDHEARVVYQGQLTAKGWLRVAIPLPAGDLRGMVTIHATFCFASPVDPQDPINYTRAGLEVVFRPHEEKRIAPKSPPKSRAFFRAREEYLTERELRDDHHKWETTLNASARVRPDNLLRPVFDVHYHAREMGRIARSAPILPYALVVTVSAPGVPDLYNRIVRRYRTELRPLVPRFEIPVRTRADG